MASITLKHKTDVDSKGKGKRKSKVTKQVQRRSIVGKVKVIVSLSDIHTIAQQTSTSTGHGNAVQNCASILVHLQGGTKSSSRMGEGTVCNFSLRFKRRAIPMVIRRISLNGRVFYMFQIAYTVDETTSFPGMLMFVDVCGCHLTLHVF